MSSDIPDIGHVTYWAQMFAQVAIIAEVTLRAEGYKAENAYRESQGQAQAYPEQVFAELANDVKAATARLNAI